jgi:putative ABC transport system substrate-binding protein
MRRREFITLLSAATVIRPIAAWAQQREQIARIGVLMSVAANDPESQPRITAFRESLQKLGWTEGRNVRIDVRWAGGDAALDRKFATELVTLTPDVILATASPAVAAVQAATRTVPIVFAHAVDPVGGGFVDSLARPGGNATGFTVYEYSIGGKWLELLKQVAPQVTRVAVLRESGIAAGPGLFGAIQALAPSFGLELRPIDVRDAAEIERGIATFAQGSNSGMIVSGSPAQSAHRDLIASLAAKHRLPTIYNARFFAAGGGLISYGADFNDQSRRAASYVDRILKGEKPVDLPVQAPTKYELVINLKTAKALGLTVPPTLLARADEVIE